MDGLLVICIISSCTSAVITTFLLLTSSYHSNWSADNHSGPQKIHHNPTLRIGGISIAIAVFLALVFSGHFLGMGVEDQLLIGQIFLATLPVFISGVLEDLRKNVSANWRLLAGFVSAGAFIAFANIAIANVAIMWVDSLLSIWIVAVIFTAISIVAHTNGMNIIDGLNGLALGNSALALLAISYLAYIAEIDVVAIYAVILLGAIAGLFFFNFPYARIFIGDGGAYLFGTSIAFLVIILANQSDEGSPLSALLIVIYPCYELLRSTVRRLRRVHTVMMPDNMHLHSKIYRFVHHYIQNRVIHPKRYANPIASVIVLLLPCFATISAVIWHGHNSLLWISVILFIVTYELLYKLIPATYETD